MQSNSLNKQVKVRRTKEQWQEILLAAKGVKSTFARSFD